MWSLVDPIDVRWIFLSHDDHDHVGNLTEVLAACPRATLVTTWFQGERLAGDLALPMERSRWVNNGERFGPDGRFVAVRPPIYDAPTTRGLFDTITGFYWAGDALAAMVPGAVDDSRDVDADMWEATFLDLNRMVSPWHAIADQGRWDSAVDAVAGLPLRSVASAHGAPLRGATIEHGLSLLRSLPSMPEAHRLTGPWPAWAGTRTTHQLGHGAGRHNWLAGPGCRGHRPQVSNGRIHQERLEVGDAFGQVLQSCHASSGAVGVAFELIERSDGYLGVGDAARYFVGPGEWSETSQFACEQARGRVLDVGAGAGRISLALQGAGDDVVALDISAGATAVCRERGVRRVFTGTVFDFVASGPGLFDTFVMLGNNLGLLGGVEQAPVLLDALASMATPGARIVGETVDPYQTISSEHLAYHEENRRLGRLSGQLRLRVRHLRLTTPWWDYLFCSPEELEAVVAPTRWRLVDAHRAPGGATGEPPAESWPPGQWTATLQLDP
ncbi:MAG TPA: methyltransferase domain-containing protein [Acidimicrobiales bacterium]|nr:methyltransferase domain-containing protein [Acidimicrobiales bacterium]